MGSNILNKHGKYNVNLHIENTADETTDIYILSLYDTSLIFRCTYTLLGKYSIKKHMWCWANNSSHVSSDVSNHTKNMRNILRTNNKIQKFVTKDSMSLSYDKLFNYLDTVAQFQHAHLICDTSPHYINVFMVNKILFNSSKLL